MKTKSLIFQGLVFNLHRMDTQTETPVKMCKVRTDLLYRVLPEPLFVGRAAKILWRRDIFNRSTHEKWVHQSWSCGRPLNVFKGLNRISLFFTTVWCVITVVCSCKTGLQIVTCRLPYLHSAPGYPPTLFFSDSSPKRKHSPLLRTRVVGTFDSSVCLSMRPVSLYSLILPWFFRKTPIFIIPQVFLFSQTDRTRRRSWGRGED